MDGILPKQPLPAIWQSLTTMFQSMTVLQTVYETKEQ